MKVEEELLDKIDKETKPKGLWCFLFSCYCFFNYNFPQFIKRTKCRIFGCQRYSEQGGWNLPIEAYIRYCKRCGASESNYDHTTDYQIIEKDEAWMKG